MGPGCWDLAALAAPGLLTPFLDDAASPAALPEPDDDFVSCGQLGLMWPSVPQWKQTGLLVRDWERVATPGRGDVFGLSSVRGFLARH